MKLYYLSFIASFLLIAPVYGIKLTHHVLKTVDGVPGLMDHDKIYKSLCTRKMVTLFRDGGNPKTSPIKEIVFEGKKYPAADLLIHKFQGKIYSLKELAHKDEKTSNPQEKKELKKVLKELKRKFQVLMSLNLQEALGTKAMLLHLIKESCQKRNRPDSVLIKWGQVPDGKEHESIQHNITSLKGFVVFCTDLIHFLEDMVESCPKARKQYEDWAKKHTKA